MTRFVIQLLTNQEKSTCLIWGPVFGLNVVVKRKALT